MGGPLPGRSFFPKTRRVISSLDTSANRPDNLDGRFE